MIHGFAFEKTNKSRNKKGGGSKIETFAFRGNLKIDAVHKIFLNVSN